MRTILATITILAMLLWLPAPLAAAQTPDDPDETPREKAQEQKQDERQDEDKDKDKDEDKDDEETPPSLDDLLGLDDDDDSKSADEAARRDTEEELERALAGRRMTDALEVALTKMDLSAELLEVDLDPGLGTQRVQEEILAKLDELIDEAQKQMQNMPGGSSGQSRSRSQQQNSMPKQGQAQPNQGRRSDSASDSGNAAPPGGEDADPNQIIDESRAEWGNLPERERDMLRQGSSGRVSSLYKRLTREYYIRLAEQSP